MLATNAVAAAFGQEITRALLEEIPWLCRCHSHPGNLLEDGFILDQCRRMVNISSRGFSSSEGAPSVIMMSGDRSPDWYELTQSAGVSSKACLERV